MNEGSADSPRQTRGVRIAGVEITSLNTGAKQFHCKPHDAFITAFLKPGFGWEITASCRICDQAALQPILDAIQAAEGNGNGARARPNAEPASASEAEKRTGPTLDAWKLIIHDRARTEIDRTFRRHGALAAEMLRIEPIETFIATVNQQRSLPNDHFTHDPDGLTSIEIEKEVETIAYALQEQYQKGGDSEQADDEASGAEVMAPPDPIDLDTPNLDPLPRGIFPQCSENYIDAVAAETETPRELVAGIELGVIATANQRKAVIEIKPGYREPLNLFVMPAMDSGNRKSAVVNKVTGTARNWQSEQVEAQKPLIVRARSFRETENARIAELRKRAAKAKGEEFETLKGELVTLEMDLPEVPTPFQMIAGGDCTIEKMGQLMASNCESLSIIDDEAAFLEILSGRYSAGIPNLELVLQAYSGSPHQVSRLGREIVMLHSPALTIAISPQPEFLRGLAVKKPEFRSRGLFARFLYLLPPSPLGYRTGDGPPIPASVEREHDRAIRALLSAKRPADGPNVIKLSPEAYAAFRAFSAHIETTMREGGSLEHMRDFAGKIPGSAARIAGNLHLGDLALHSDPFSVALPKATMMRALDCADVFIKHAVATLDLMGTNEDVTGARRVWEWIKRKRKPRFTFHEAHLALRGSFQRSGDLETPIEVLVERYYIISVPPDPSVPRPRGRPTRPFEVNPKLSEGWES